MVPNDNQWIRIEMEDVIPYFADKRGILIDNSLGNPLTIDNLGISGPSIHQGFHIMNWENYTGKSIENAEKIVEFGGGYGRLCSMIHDLGFEGEYYIYDQPEFSYLQEYYLSNQGVFDVNYMIMDDWNRFPPPPKDVDVLLGMNSLDEVTESTRVAFINAVDADSVMLAVNIGKRNDMDMLERLTKKVRSTEWEFLKSSSRRGTWYAHGKKK
jgi:hypothetical protein